MNFCSNNFYRPWPLSWLWFQGFGLMTNIMCANSLFLTFALGRPKGKQVGFRLCLKTVCHYRLWICAGLEHDVTEVSYKKTDFWCHRNIIMSSANLSVCCCRGACSLSPCVQGHLLAVLLSDWNCPGSRQRASAVFTQWQDLLVSLPVALSLCKADMNWQGQRMRESQNRLNHWILCYRVYLSRIYGIWEMIIKCNAP